MGKALRLYWRGQDIAHLFSEAVYSMSQISNVSSEQDLSYSKERDLFAYVSPSQSPINCEWVAPQGYEEFQLEQEFNIYNSSYACDNRNISWENTSSVDNASRWAMWEPSKTDIGNARGLEEASLAAVADHLGTPWFH